MNARHSHLGLLAATFMGDSGSTLEAESETGVDDQMASGADVCSANM